MKSHYLKIKNQEGKIFGPYKIKDYNRINNSMIKVTLYFDNGPEKDSFRSRFIHNNIKNVFCKVTNKIYKNLFSNIHNQNIYLETISKVTDITGYYHYYAYIIITVNE